MEHIHSSPHQFQSKKGTIILEGKGSIPHSIKTVAKRCINNMLLVLTKQFYCSMRKQNQSIMTLMPHIGLLTDFSILNSILWSQNLTGLIVYLRVRLTHSLFLLGWRQFGIKDLNRFIVVVLYFIIISAMFMHGHFYSFLVKRTL